MKQHSENETNDWEILILKYLNNQNVKSRY